MNESAIQSQIRIEASRLGLYLFRNNSGACTDESGRLIRYGLGNDSARVNAVLKSSDLVGFTPVVIRPEHVGQTVAIFTGVECKGPDWRGKPRNDRERAQEKFLQLINQHGGIGIFAAGIEDLQIIGSLCRGMP